MIEYTPKNIKTWARLGSCGAFGIAATEIPEEDDNVVMLTSDLLYYSGLERFKNKYPDRLYNMGIAEQNMVGVAAGMAKEGLNPFATTYATFATTRCCDQVRVNMGYMKLGIKLVGLTSGLSVGILGATHMSIEDMAIMRSIPNITILSPADCTETIKATIAAAKHKGPVYLRLTGVMGNPVVYKQDYDYQIGKAITLKEGTDISIIATGTMVYYALEASKELENKGISCKVVDMHTIKPLDKKSIKDACDGKLIVTLEEHSIIGGLGSAVAEVLAGCKKRPPQLIIGIADEYKHAGSYEYLLQKYGLTTTQIVNKINNKYSEVR
ncbi:transketolase family protein [Acetobacterium bakii]|uniref:Transketolase n=1 Tax=Acetobacterium bakii TaxID=52689 RepID=A0A0L6U2C9_9FIRM|nr:transketolase C-terminal domain-containing protein [Acetobacterium bakii]KNZ42666.1 transketolase [Acetobacterium bakii]